VHRAVSISGWGSEFKVSTLFLLPGIALFNHSERSPCRAANVSPEMEPTVISLFYIFGDVKSLRNFRGNRKGIKHRGFQDTGGPPDDSHERGIMEGFCAGCATHGTAAELIDTLP
jgi:predicted secreted protein